MSSGYAAEQQMACAHETAQVRSIYALKWALPGSYCVFFSWHRSHCRGAPKQYGQTRSWACHERASSFRLGAVVDNAATVFDCANTAEVASASASKFSVADLFQILFLHAQVGP
jgi:hypothetical protein